MKSQHFFRPLNIIGGVTRCGLFFSKVEENSRELVTWMKEKFKIWYKTTQIYIIQFGVPWLLMVVYYPVIWFQKFRLECVWTSRYLTWFHKIRPDFIKFKFNTWLVIRKMGRVTCCVVKSTCHIIVTVCNLRRRREI